MAYNDFNDFNDMDDLFRQLMNGMGGFNSENRRYLINGRQVSPKNSRNTKRPAACQAMRPKRQRAASKPLAGSWRNWAAT